MRDERMTVFHGERDYVHVDDVCRAILLACKDQSDGLHTYNICTGIGTSAHKIADQFPDLKQTKSGYRDGDPVRIVGNNGKAVEHLLWSPTKTVSDMVADVEGWVHD